MVAGRPEKNVDWNIVEKLLIRQCKGNEIASEFGMTDETFYNKVQDKFGIKFSAYSVPFYAKGKQLLRAKIFDKAMAGDNRLLLKLGDVHLGYSDEAIKSNNSGNIHVNLGTDSAACLDEPIQSQTLPTKDPNSAEQRD